MNSPDFKKVIVDKALEDYFALNDDIRSRQREILKSCQDFPNRVYIKTTLRLQRLDRIDDRLELFELPVVVAAENLI